MNRKTPCNHDVKSHTRKGYSVRSYNRGRGSSSQMEQPYRSMKYSSQREGSTRKTPEHFKIVFHYSKGRQETVNVLARDMDDALNQGLQIRKKNLKPINLEIQDGLGDLLRKIGHGLKKVAVAGAEAAGAVKGTYEAGRLKYESAKITDLVEGSFSPDLTTRTLSNQRLREKYPDVYSHLGHRRV